MQLLVGAFRSLRAVADLVEPRLRAECCGARADAATLLGELPRLPSQRLRLGDVQPHDRVLRKRLDHARLQILSVRAADELERFARDSLDFGQLAEPGCD